MGDANESSKEKISAHPLDLGDFDALKVFHIILNTLKKLKDKAAIILWSSFILLTFWGLEGNAKLVFPEKWREALFPDLAWRDQLVSFVVGFILIVVIPCCIIKFYFKESLSKYGLGWSKDKTKPGLVALAVLFVVALPLFLLGTGDADMQKVYPLFGKDVNGNFKITTWGGFIVYELVYFLFFINIEFIFRGYLLFGLYGIRDKETGGTVPGTPGPLVFGVYAVLIQMLAYTMWHIPKPTPEYIGALFWGVIVAAIALKIRSIWPIIIVHWALNVILDTVLWLR
ncbi:MAG: CPBP family intramembrane metalloprotease [Candidatus Aminicenantes bacterium]|nr:MAG: CPBP family intramembrane metalloprotease [Candidatus Aminicenantes bacterium]